VVNLIKPEKITRFLRRFPTVATQLWWPADKTTVNHRSAQRFKSRQIVRCGSRATSALFPAQQPAKPALRLRSAIPKIESHARAPMETKIREPDH
jgi:hypothetical protein